MYKLDFLHQFKMEDTILPNDFHHIKASIKDLLEIYNNDFSANN